MVACCLAAMAVALVGVVTLAGGGTGTVSQILTGQGSVKSAWLSMTESGVTLSGPCDYLSSTGRFEVTGTYLGALVGSLLPFSGKSDSGRLPVAGCRSPGRLSPG